MTETTTAEPRDAAKDVIAMTSATLAADLVAAMLNELRSIPDHWTRLAAERQQQSIENLKERARAIVAKGLSLIAGGNFPAVPATLDFVSSRKGISAGLTIDKGALARHALFDAQGQRVLVVIADAAAWCERLDEIKAKDDQLKLFDPDVNYDPKRDQPGYRRDQDPFVPAGPTWADLKNSLKSSGHPPFEAKLADGNARCQCGVEKTDVQCGLPLGHEGEHKLGQEPPADDKPPPVEGKTEGEATPPALAEDLRAKLEAIGVTVTPDEIGAWTALQFNVAQEWVEAYAEGMQTLNDRPDFLPVPNKEGKKK